MSDLSKNPTPPTRRSLTWHFLVLVVATTVPAALLATWASTHALERALHASFEAHALHALDAAHARMEAWWSARERELAGLAEQSHDVRSAVADGAAGVSAPTSEQLATAHARLEHVHARSPYARSVFVLDGRGRVLLAVGERIELPESLLLERGQTSSPPISDLAQLGSEPVQIVSAPIGSTEPPVMLHALLRIPLEDLLRSEHDLVIELERPAPELESLPQSAAAVPSPVPHSAAASPHIVRATRRVPRFGWTLAIEEPVDGALAPLARVGWLVLLVQVGAALLGGGIALVLALPVARHIRVLAEAAHGLAEGQHWSAVPERGAGDELDALTRAFNRMAARMNRHQRQLSVNRERLSSANAQLRGQNEELLRLNQNLEQLSNTDGLTGLFNHRFFQEQLTREIARVERSGDPLSLVLIDIDDFKLLNDTHGHATGDAVLREVARTMNGLVRDADMLARYGGEEFALLATRAELASAIAIAEKIRLALSHTRVALESGGEVRVSVSIGVSCYAGDRRRFFEDADRALYRAKEQGKDCVCS